TMSVIFYGLILYAFVKFCQWRNSLPDTKEDITGDIEFLSVTEQLDKVNGIRDRLQTIENIITDVTVCRPDECIKYITVSCPTVTGEREYNFMVNGENATTEKILALLYDERKNLRTSLRIETQKLAERCNGNCNADNEKSVFMRGGECLDRREIL
ncbi:MAG: hypothetical protein K2G14_07930, partial [Ruminococcus sp.]|nr:hypothetical protein [Ruminococcus sp.]